MLRRLWVMWMWVVGLFSTPGAAVAQTLLPPAAAAPLVWADCQPGQVQILLLGTFHFDQSRDVDVLEAHRQSELREVIERLALWAPTRIAVEYPHAEQADLDSLFHDYVRRDGPGASRNEIAQIGFRLAERLGHRRVHAVDTPMNLWHDSIQVFDDRWPTLRDQLRARWPLRMVSEDQDPGGSTLAEILRALNADAPPGNSDMYAGFLPLVEDDVYAGALKLRPWYDRNLRIVQNLFRVSTPNDDRVLLVIGAGHVRVLKQIMEITPQLCPVSALPVLNDTRDPDPAGPGPNF